MWSNRVVSEPQTPVRLDDVPDLLPFEDDLRALSIRDVRAVRHEDGSWSAHVLFGQYRFRTERKRGIDATTATRNALVWSFGPRPDREAALAAVTVLLTALVTGRRQARDLHPAAREPRADDEILNDMVLEDWLHAHDSKSRRGRGR